MLMAILAPAANQKGRETMSSSSVTLPPAYATSVTVEPIASRRDRMRLIKFPWKVYANIPQWVPPLIFERRMYFDPARNPFFRHADVQLFIARRGGQDVGTIAAFVNQAYNAFQAARVAFFGFFEVLPDEQAAAALLAAAEAWARARGVEAIRGPINFSTDNESGLLIDAFDEAPVLMTVYNPPYYREFIEAAGYAKALDWYAYTVDRATLGGGKVEDLPPKLVRAAEIARRRSKATFRKVRMREFDQELAKVQGVYNQAWERNPSFVPMDDAEIEYLAGGLKSFIDPDLVWMAEVDGRLVGVSITLPDMNQVVHQMNGRLLPFGWRHLVFGRSKIDTARFFAMGVLPEYRQRGIDAVFYYETFREAVRKGYQRAELSLIAEENLAMRRPIESLGARIAKTYRVYKKAL
jgi:GNAT superfamily N-acetyltransferase